jgi:4-amino-4-deoxy-L-arabinose transferase-like glycosyltransferase
MRFYKLGAWSFWIDEIFTIQRAEALASSTGLFGSLKPLSIYLVTAAISSLGVGEWSARLAPTLIGIMTIPLLYFPTKKIFGPSVALIAVLLIAVSTWHLYWSQNVRFYTSLLLFYSLAMFAFYFGFERDRPWYLLAFWILLFVAFLERVSAAFLVPVVLAYLFLLRVLPFKTPPGYRLRNILIILLPMMGYFVYELFLLVTDGGPKIIGAYQQFTTWPLGPVEDPFRMGMFVVLNIGVPLVVLSTFSGVYLMLRKSRTGLFFFLGAVVPVALLLLLNPIMFTKDRYVFFTLTSWAILGAVAVKELYMQADGKGKFLAVGVLALLVVSAMSANLLYYQVNNGNRRDWRGAFELVQARSRKEDIIVSTWQEIGDYYMDEDVITWWDLNTNTVMQNGKRFWFVTDSEVVWVNPELKSWVERNAELIQIRYLRTPQDFSLRVHLYDPESHD